MKQSKTAIKELTARYRAVLLKGALINAMMIIGIGAANAESLTISSEIFRVPEDIDIPEGGYKIYDQISISGGKLIIDGDYEIYASERADFFGGEISISGGEASIHANSRISIKGDTHITIQGGGELYTYGAEPNSSDISVSGDADIIIGAGGLITSNGSLNISENAKINATSMADVMDILDTTIEAKNINITGGEISLSQSASLVALSSHETNEAYNHSGELNLSGGTINARGNSVISRIDALSPPDNEEGESNGKVEWGTENSSGSINLSGSSVNLYDNAKMIVTTGKAVSMSGGELNVFGTNSITTYDALNRQNDHRLNMAAGTINLFGRLHADILSTGGNIVFQTSASRINGELSGTGVDLTFNDNYLFSDINNKATLNTVKIAEGKTLNIGTGTLTATNITGGTISAVLTDAAKNTAIITGNATDVTLALDMSNASRDEVTLYKITNGTGFTFADYATNRYAVSGTSFDLADASSIGALSGWNGGDLYILRLATAGEAAVEDLEKAGVLVSLAEQNAIKVLDLAQSVLSKLDAAKQEAIAKVNDLLDQAAGKAQETKQILREIAPDTSSSGTKTALNTAKSVINVIGTRLGGGTSGNMRGRSGGDYAVGRSSVWAQGMYNYAKLDTVNGFKSDSTGFAAGIETNLTDSFKAGIGYAFTKTDIDTDRSQTDVDTHTGFVYGEYKPNKFYVNAIASYGHSEYDDTTNLIGLTSDYSADTIGAQIATGYNFGILTPEAALRYTHVKQDDHTDALGATMRSKSFDTWTAVGGVKLSKKYTLESNRRVGITPELKLAATYDFERDDETNTVVLADGSSYIVEGDMMKRFGVEAGANVGLTIGNDSEITLSYEGKFKKDYQDHTGLINFKYNF